jgi:hypothetical protein
MTKTAMAPRRQESKKIFFLGDLASWRLKKSFYDWRKALLRHIEVGVEVRKIEEA